MDGLLLIDKPTGLSSFDVIRRVRKIIGERKAGHTGTLDPAATGLLPVTLGSCTKLANYVSHEPKQYAFEIVFGEETDSCDDQGVVVATGPTDVDEAALRAAMAQFVGPIAQVPPRFSAVHVNGKRAYELARAGVDFELEPRDVMVHGLELHALRDGVASAQVTCGSGTYVRSLARDIGRALHTVAHARNIRRTRVGSWEVADAVTLEALDADAQPQRFVVPALAMLVAEMPVVELDAELTQRVRNGNFVFIANDLPPSELVALTTGGELLAVAEVERRGDALRLQPKRVIA